MALKVAGYDFDKLFGKKDRVIGYDRQVTTNDFRQLHGNEVVLQCVNSILSTPRTKRIRDVTFGCDLYKYIFEPSDEVTAQAIRQEVIEALEEQDERIKVRNVSIEFFTDGKGYSVNVDLALPSGEAYQQKVTITPEIFDILGEDEDGTV